MSMGLLFCAFAAALSTSACTPREKYLGGAYDAGPADAGADSEPDAGDADLVDGPEDASADLGPPCVVGGTTALVPATLDCSQAKPGRIVVSGDSVYWTVQGGGAVLVRAALAGGGPEPLVYDGAGAFGLVIDATFAYYTQPASGRVMRWPLRGGEPTPLATKLDRPQLLAGDGASLYWTAGSVYGDGKIMKLDLAPDAQPVTLIDGQANPRAIAVRDGFVYWTDVADGSILRTADHLTGPADSGVRTASRLASGLVAPTDLVLLGGFVYAPDQAGHIRRVALDGGDLETIADVDGMPYGVATDGTSIYWSVLGDEGGIYRAAPASGSGPGTVFVDGQTDPHFVAVTAENVYWTTWGGRPAVHRLAK